MRTYRSGVVARYLSGARIQFTCPGGHQTIKDYNQGAPGTRMSPAAAQHFALMWDNRIQATFTCRKCPSAGERPSKRTAMAAQP